MTTNQQLPAGWEWKKLGEITEVLGGGTPKTSILSYWGNEIVWLSPVDLPEIGTISTVSSSKKMITKLGLEKSSAKLLPRGSVVFSSRASIGKIGVTEIELATNQGFTNFICKQELFNQFLSYALKKFIPEITSLSNSTTFKEVSRSSFKNFKIPLPPLSEQKRIVKKLDEAFKNIDEAIEKIEKNILRCEEMKKSALDEVFSSSNNWTEASIDSIRESNIIGLVRSAKEQEAKRDFEYVKMNNISLNGSFSDEEIVFVDATKEELEKFSLKKGDLLFNTRNSIELVGKSCIYPFNKENVLYNNNIMRLRFRKDIDPYFIQYTFLSPKFRKKLESIKSGTTNVSAIYYKNFKTLKISLPSLDEQQKIVHYLDQVFEKTNRLKKEYQEKLQHLKDLKASILDSAFKGEM